MRPASKSLDKAGFVWFDNPLAPASLVHYIVILSSHLTSRQEILRFHIAELHRMQELSFWKSHIFGKGTSCSMIADVARDDPSTSVVAWVMPSIVAESWCPPVSRPTRQKKFLNCPPPYFQSNNHNG